MKRADEIARARSCGSSTSWGPCTARSARSRSRTSHRGEDQLQRQPAARPTVVLHSLSFRQLRGRDSPGWRPESGDAGRSPLVVHVRGRSGSTSTRTARSRWRLHDVPAPTSPRSARSSSPQHLAEQDRMCGAARRSSAARRGGRPGARRPRSRPPARGDTELVAEGDQRRARRRRTPRGPRRRDDDRPDAPAPVDHHAQPRVVGQAGRRPDGGRVAAEDHHHAADAGLEERRDRGGEQRPAAHGQQHLRAAHARRGRRRRGRSPRRRREVGHLQTTARPRPGGARDHQARTAGRRPRGDPRARRPRAPPSSALFRKTTPRAAGGIRDG